MGVTTHTKKLLRGNIDKQTNKQTVDSATLWTDQASFATFPLSKLLHFTFSHFTYIDRYSNFISCNFNKSHILCRYWGHFAEKVGTIEITNQLASQCNFVCMKAWLTILPVSIKSNQHRRKKNHGHLTVYI